MKIYDRYKKLISNGPNQRLLHVEEVLKALLTNRSDEGLKLETSAFLPFTVANLRFQLSC